MLENGDLSKTGLGENLGQMISLYFSEAHVCWNTVLICTHEYS